MKVDKYDKNGKKSGSVELPDAIFGGEINRDTIYMVLRTENRNRRQGTHKTKDFSEVSGGGKKPYSQKGTGNARQGSTRAPQFKGGAIVFGPQPRNYRIDLPEKVRKVGYLSILKARIQQNALCVVEDPEISAYSTKAIYSVFKNMGVVQRNTVTFLTDSDDQFLKKSMLNIPQVLYMNARRPMAPELYHSGQVVIAESALKYLTEKYGSQ